MKYKSNRNVVYSCKYHVVWCPKYRRKVLVQGVDERRYALIVHEDISPQFMLRNRRLAREAADVGWAQFLTFLQRKAAAAGRKVVAVNPANTSQLYSGCGQIVPKKLSDRWYLCPHCGTSLDRDHNAAINILRLAG